MKRTRLYNTNTGKWEYFTVTEVHPHPLRLIRLGVLRTVRGLRDARARRSDPPVLEFDPVTLRMRDVRAERRRLRLARREERFQKVAKAANALNSMVEMQKHIG